MNRADLELLEAQARRDISIVLDSIKRARDDLAQMSVDIEAVMRELRRIEDVVREQDDDLSDPPF